MKYGCMVYQSFDGTWKFQLTNHKTKTESVIRAKEHGHLTAVDQVRSSG
jgi:hypothetical protein